MSVNFNIDATGVGSASTISGFGGQEEFLIPPSVRTTNMDLSQPAPSQQHSYLHQQMVFPRQPRQTIFPRQPDDVHSRFIRAQFDGSAEGNFSGEGRPPYWPSGPSHQDHEKK